MGSVADLHKSVQASRKERARLKQRYGCIPMSVLEINRGALSKRMYIYQQEEPDRRIRSTQSSQFIEGATEESTAIAQEKHRMKIASRFKVGKKVARGTNAASIMPAELVEFFIKYYSKKGDVYLDPFMGQGIQMQVAHLMGRHYYGYDLSEEFCAYIEKVKAKIDNGTTELRTICGDSRFPEEIPDGVGDFSFHSPPYWDIEYYGDEPGQLGMNTYEDFLKGMEDVARAWLPKFKTGAFHVVNVNDFRRGGDYIPYHADTISLFCRAGWVIHDTWIIKGLVGGLSKVFGVQRHETKIAPKIHEYAIVFRKGD